MKKLNTIILLLFCAFLVKAQTLRSMRVDSVFNSRSYQSSSMASMVQALNKRAALGNKNKSICFIFLSFALSLHKIGCPRKKK